MRILMLTRRVDQHDSRMGFAHRWISALANHPRVQSLDVICLSKGAYDLPDNVTVWSMGKERGKNRFREFINFQRALAQVIRRVDIIFGHMIPRYTLVAAPWALLFGVPMVQWYTHRSVHLELRLAHALVQRVVTAAPESFRIESNKKIVVGHGIDMYQFTPPDDPQDSQLVLSVGRLSPVKNLPHLLRGFAQLTRRPGMADARLLLVGGPTSHDPDYPQTLQAIIAEENLADRVEMLGPVPHENLPDFYQRAAATANLCPTGGLDKVVIESMACATPVLVHNDMFLPLLGDDAGRLFCPSLEPTAVADHLAFLLMLPPAERRALGGRLRARVRERYGLEGLIDRLVGIFAEVLAA